MTEQSGQLRQLTGDGDSSTSFRRYFTSKSGNVFDAHDYGHKFWPIGKSK